MNKKQTTILVSIAAVTMVNAIIVLNSLNTAIASNDPAARDPLFSSHTEEALKIIVEIDSPYGHDDITSFIAFQTDNLVAKQPYHILRLEGPVMKDKPAVLPWVADYLNKLPNGLSADGVSVRVGDIAKLTKPTNSTKFDNTIASTGKVTLKLLQGQTDVEQTDKVRQIDFSGCYIAVILQSSEKYRYPVVIEDQSQLKLETQSKQVVKQVIVTRTELDKQSYKTGDKATFTVTFTDLEGNNIDPDTIRAYYDSQVAKLQKQDVGVYTFATPSLTKTDHQLIVSNEKKDFVTDTTYLTIPIQHIS